MHFETRMHKIIFFREKKYVCLPYLIYFSIWPKMTVERKQNTASCEYKQLNVRETKKERFLMIFQHQKSRTDVCIRF